MTIGFKANNDGSGAIQVNGVDRATVDTSGNLGIGVTPSAWSGYGGLVELKGIGAVVSANTNMQVGANWFYNGTDFIYKTTAAASYYQQNAGAHSWGTAPSGTAGNAFTFTERFRIASDGQQSSVIPGGSVLYPEYKCRAWVNFNGTGTVAIRASGNVSSITDNGVGDYTVNFTTAMPDANYSTVIKTNRSSANTTLVNISRIADELSSPTTSIVRIAHGVPDTNRVLQREDASFVCVSIFR